MAYEQWSNDIIVREPAIITHNGFSITTQLAYRLYIEPGSQTPTYNTVLGNTAPYTESNIGNFKVKVEVTYLHLRLSSENYKVETDSYITGVSTSLLPGKFSDFDSSVNSQNAIPDEFGDFSPSTFRWPYPISNSQEIQGAAQYSINVIPTELCSWINKWLYESSSICTILINEANMEDHTDTSGFTVAYKEDSSALTESERSSTVVAYGTAFKDTELYSGRNKNNQTRIRKYGTIIDIATSSLEDGSGNSLTYDVEYATDTPSGLVVSDPLTGDSCLASVEISASDLAKYGLLKYNNSGFDFVDGTEITTDDIAYIVPALLGAFSSHLFNSYLVGNRLPLVLSLGWVEEIRLSMSMQPEPDDPLPDPITSLEMVCILKIVDGKPTWVKCVRHGREDV